MTALDQAPHLVPPQDIRPSLLQLLVKFGEMGLLFLWFASFIVPFPGSTVIKYLAAGIALVSCYVHVKNFTAVARKMWVLCMMPLMVMLSSIWSTHHFDGFVYAISYDFSIIMMIFAVARFTCDESILCFLGASLVAGVFSAVAPHTKSAFAGTQQAALGIFAQKNILGKRMTMLAASSLYFIVKPGVRLRFIGAATVPVFLGLVMTLRADSMTSDLTLGLALIALIGLTVVWRVVGLLKGGISLAIITVLAAAVVCGIVFSTIGLNPISAALAAVHKSDTLTGRTDIWAFAPKIIDQHPWLGWGARGFWQPDSPEAVQIASTYKGPGEFDFVFHDSYLETTVHIGFIGLALFIFSNLYTGFVLLRDFIKFQDTQSAFFVVVYAVTMARSFVESELFSAGEANQMVLWLGCGYALMRLERKRMGSSDHWSR